MFILLVEDDRALCDGLADLLRHAGHDVKTSQDGRHALALMLQTDFDLAIVDLGLPGLDGLEVIRAIRDRHIGLPVLVITARGSLNERIDGLDAGADDYLIKPFEIPEFEARVRALLRRHRDSRAAEVRIGSLVFVPGNPQVTLGDTKVELSPSELALLELLTHRQGRIISKDKIANRLDRGDDPPTDTAIEICVHRLRRKLLPYGLKIRTLRGFGYLVELDDDGR